LSAATHVFGHSERCSGTLAPEPDGMSECDVLFRTTWEPMYLAGAGSSSLEFPENTAHKIAAGTQLLSQLRLFNTTDKLATGSLEVKMHRSTASDRGHCNCGACQVNHFFRSVL
jgi:hypothetical protein